MQPHVCHQLHKEGCPPAGREGVEKREAGITHCGPSVEDPGQKVTAVMHFQGADAIHQGLALGEAGSVVGVSAQASQQRRRGAPFGSGGWL